MSAAGQLLTSLAALIDDRVSVALDIRDRANQRRKLSDTAAEIQRQAARGLSEPSFGRLGGLDDRHQPISDLDVLLHRISKPVQDLVERLESLSFCGHQSSPVVADAGAATPGDPALTVQEGVDTAPGVGAVGCRCNAAPAGSSEAA